MYENNVYFCEAFANLFTREEDFKVFRHTTVNWKMWNDTCERDTLKFFTYINIYDKFAIYSWVRSNTIDLYKAIKTKPSITNFSMTKKLCDRIFDSKSEDMWNAWLNICDGDGEKFIKYINIHDKLALAFW